MNTALLSADKDPMGAAIADYFKRHRLTACEFSLHNLTKTKYR